jgi:hypothetical protein
MCISYKGLVPLVIKLINFHLFSCYFFVSMAIVALITLRANADQAYENCVSSDILKCEANVLSCYFFLVQEQSCYSINLQFRNLTCLDSKISIEEEEFCIIIFIFPWVFIIFIFSRVDISSCIGWLVYLIVNKKQFVAWKQIERITRFVEWAVLHFIFSKILLYTYFYVKLCLIIDSKHNNCKV